MSLRAISAKGERLMNAKTNVEEMTLKMKRQRERIKKLNKKLKTKSSLHVMQPQTRAPQQTPKKKTLTEAVFDAVVEYMRDEVTNDVRRAA